MQLTVFNGSPRPGDNNTGLMVEKFVEGFANKEGNKYKVYKLNKLGSMDEARELFEKSEYVLLAFPLYSYSMPAGVKEFMEALSPLCGKCSGKKIGFLVQYGFKEAIHARALEKYLEKLAGLLNCEYLGTIIKGGCDGLIKNPNARFSKKVLNGINKIGCKFGESSKFDKELLDRYSRPETQSKTSKLLSKLFVKIVNKYYWGAELKKNGVYDKSYAQPYKRLNNT